MIFCGVLSDELPGSDVMPKTNSLSKKILILWEGSCNKRAQLGRFGGY